MSKFDELMRKHPRPWTADDTGGHLRIQDAAGKSIAIADVASGNALLWSGIVEAVNGYQDSLDADMKRREERLRYA